MGDTSIEWTDRTWNPVTGCTKVSPGCKNCYAEAVADRFWAKQYPPISDGRDRRFTDVICHPDRLEQPLHWRKPQRIFVNSMSDLFHENVPEDFISQVFAVMFLAKHHTFQILTKRPERMLEYCLAAANDPFSYIWAWASEFEQPCVDVPREINFPLPSVHLGISVENQKYADERIPKLLQTPAAVRFISYEPALESVTFSRWLGPGYLDWLIIGGESGNGARPFNIQWARDVIQQCRAAGVACFVKQMGSKPVRRCNNRACQTHPGMCPLFGGEHGHGHDGMLPIYLSGKGGDMADWAEDLRVREFPV